MKKIDYLPDNPFIHEITLKVNELVDAVNELIEIVSSEKESKEKTA